MLTGSMLKFFGITMLALFFSAGLISPVRAAQPLDTIQLDNGILLRDWLNLPAVQSVQNPLETGERAAMYIKRYGPYRELLDIVMKATHSKQFEERSIKAKNAAQKLAELDQARTKLGEWPQLIISHARAASLSGKPDMALADLKSWLKLVPVSDKRRTEIVALVIESETDGAAVTRYFGGGEAAESGPDIGPIKTRPLPPEVAGLQEIIEQVLNCTGRARSAFDAEMVTEGKFSSDTSRGKPYYTREVQKSYDRGLWSSETTRGEKDPDTEIESFFLQTPISMVYYDHNRRSVGGPLKGSVSRTRQTVNEISCDAPYFPLKVGKKSTVRQVTKSETTETGYSNKTDRFVKEHTATTQVNQVYSVAEALKRFPNLRISGPGTENWLVYEMSGDYGESYLSVEVSDPSTRQYYKPSHSQLTNYLYIEGPNFVVLPNSYNDILLPGWTVTVRELP